MRAKKVRLCRMALAICVVTTGIEGTLSVKLHRELGVTQRTAWYMAHRTRESFNDATTPAAFAGQVAVEPSDWAR